MIMSVGIQLLKKTRRHAIVLTALMIAAFMTLGTSSAESAKTNAKRTTKPRKASGAQSTTSAWTQVARIKETNPAPQHMFGGWTALSADGSTLAVSAIQEDGASRQINGDPKQAGNITLLSATGAVFVYVRDASGNWTQQAYLKGSSFQVTQMGTGLAFTPDGNTLAVGASSSQGAERKTREGKTEYGFGAGVVVMFAREPSGVWKETAMIMSNDGRPGDHTGSSIGLSADGSVLVAGAPDRDFDSTVTDEEASKPNPPEFSGAAYVFVRQADGTWLQRPQLRSPQPRKFARFGHDVAISADAKFIAVGAAEDPLPGAGVATSVPTTGASVTALGAVYLYERQPSGEYALSAFIKPPKNDALQTFGSSVAFSGDGQTLAVGSDYNALNSTIDAALLPGNYKNAGQVFTYRRSGQSWVYHATVRPVVALAFDTGFGADVALSSNGDRLLVGMPKSRKAIFGGGATFVYIRIGSGWSLDSTLVAKPSNENGHFGNDVSMSADGRLIAVGAADDSGPGAGVNGPLDSKGISTSGTAFVFATTK
jgi:trimeric autotransporter adhesin